MTQTLAIDPSHERFHPRSDDPHWNESAWFGVTLTELEASLYVYFYHRPNMNLSAGGVFMWDPSGSTEYDCLVYDWNRCQALPRDAEMFDFTLDNGLSVECVEPFEKYVIRHSGAVEAELEWQKYIDPFIFGMNAGLEGWTTEAEGYSNGHYQQLGRLSGTVRLADGTVFDIDGGSIRDRSWSVRNAVAARRCELAWVAASPTNGFSCYSVSTSDLADDPVLGTEDALAFGYYVRDSVGSRLSSGRTQVLERGPDGRPLRMVIDAEDELGRSLHARGRGLNALVWSVYDRTYQLPCTTMWEFDGVEASGEIWTCMPTELARGLLRGS